MPRAPQETARVIDMQAYRNLRMRIWAVLDMIKRYRTGSETHGISVKTNRKRLAGVIIDFGEDPPLRRFFGLTPERLESLSKGDPIPPKLLDSIEAEYQRIMDNLSDYV